MATERIELINSLDKYNRMMIKLGYTAPQIIRDAEILNDFYVITEKGMKTMDAYEHLSIKYRLKFRTIRDIVAKLKREV